MSALNFARSSDAIFPLEVALDRRTFFLCHLTKKQRSQFLYVTDGKKFVALDD
jgi:hypothetical protein